MMITSSSIRLLFLPLIRHSRKLQSLSTIRCLSCSVLESTEKLNLSQQSTNSVSTDVGKKLSLKSTSGKSIYDQKLIVNGENVPEPWDSFDCYSWPEAVRDYLIRKGITQPTRIQSQVWPIALDGRDLVGISTTGSGKTLAFALPALVHVESLATHKRYIGPSVVILTPTRELAQQIHQVFVEIGLNIPTCIFGGAARRIQTDSLIMRQPSILISTPGRLNDFIDEKKIDLSKCTFCVLDEADRMLELGLEAQIRRIVEKMPKPPFKKQMLLFSATWPKEVHDLSLDFLRDFVQINVGSAKLIANPAIEQNFLFIEPLPKAKEEALVNLLNNLDDGTKKLPNQKILIFVSTKYTADYLQRYLTSKGFYPLAIHSNRPQQSRNLILDAFRAGNRPILIGTDIASRGLDIDDISVVINYDMPNSIEDYVHRIGRTARSEKCGTSYSLFMPDDARLAIRLVELLKDSNQIIDPKLIIYAKLNSRQQANRDKNGYRRYGAPMKQRIQDKQNLMTNYRKAIYK